MKLFDMSDKTTFLHKISAKFHAFKFIFFMKWFNLPFHTVFSCTGCITFDTLKEIIFLMNWWNVTVQFWYLFNLVSHLMQSKDFFPSWTDEMCKFKYSFLEKVLLDAMQSYTLLFPLWILAICFSKRNFIVNFPLHWLHPNRYLHSWTDSKWNSNAFFRENFASQIVRSNGFFPLWTDSIWLFKFDALSN